MQKEKTKEKGASVRADAPCGKKEMKLEHIYYTSFKGLLSRCTVFSFILPLLRLPHGYYICGVVL